MAQPKDYQAALQALEQQRAACQQAEAETASVRSKLHNAVKKGKAIATEKSFLATQLERIQQELVALQASKKQAHDQTAESSKPNGTIHNSSELEDLRKCNASLEQRVADLAGQLQTEAEQAAILQSSFDALKQASAALTTENETLLQQREAQVAEESSSAAVLASMREELAAERSAFNQVQQEKDAAIASLKAETAQLSQANIELKQQAGPLEQRLADADALIAELRESQALQVSGLSQQQQAQQVTIDSLQAEVEQLRQENSSLQQQIAGNNEKAETHTDVTALEAQLEQLRQENEDLLQRAMAIERTTPHDVHAKELERLREGHAAEQRQLLQQLQEQHRQELEAAQAKLQEENDARLLELRAALTGAEAETAAAHATVRELQAELRRIEQGRVAADEEQAMVQEHSRQLERQLAAAQEAAESAQRGANAMEAELISLRQCCQELQDAAADPIAVDSREAQNTVLENGDDIAHEGAATSRVIELQQALQAAQASEADLKRQLGRMQVDTLSASEGVAEVKKRLQRELEDAQLDLEEARNDAGVMHEALQAAAARITEAQVAEAAAVAEAERRQEEAADLRRRLAEAEGALSVQDNLEAELNESAEHLSRVRDEVEDLRGKLQEAVGDGDAQARRVSELEDQIAEAQRDHAGKLEQAETLRREATQQAEAAQRIAAAEVTAARQQRTEADAALRAAEAAQAAARQSVTAAESRAAAAEEAMEKLHAEVTARNQRFGLIHSTFSKKEADMQGRLKAAEERAEALQQAVLDHQQAAETAQKAASASEQERETAFAACQALQTQVEKLKDRLQNPQHVAAVQRAEIAASAAEQRAQDAEEQARQAGLGYQSLQEALSQAHKVASDAAHRAEELSEQLQRAQSEAAALRELQHPMQNGMIKAENPMQNGVIKGENHAGQNGILSPTPSATAVDVPPGALSEIVEELREKVAELEEENTNLQQRAQGDDKRIAAATAVQHAQIASLEKHNQELQWQVAMLARDPEAQPIAPKHMRHPANGGHEGAVVGGSEALPKLVGLVLRHRRILVWGYVMLLHVLVYWLLSNRGASNCLSPLVDAIDPDRLSSLKGSRKFARRQL